MGGTDLGAALELLLGVTEHLNIQEEPESVVHRSKTCVSKGYEQPMSHRPDSGKPQLQFTLPRSSPSPSTLPLFHPYSLGLRFQLLQPWDMDA